MEYSWDFSVLWLYKGALVKGLILTLWVTSFGIFFGTVLGLTFALARISSYKIIRSAAATYVETFRAIPLLVLLVWAYYCLPIIGLELSALQVAYFCMSINLGAFVAETIRAGIEAMPSGYLESARALGMSKWQSMKRIIIPHTLRDTMPSLMNLYITLLKFSSLLSVIAVPELLHSANNIISQTYRPLEIYSGIAVIYLLVIIPLSLFSRRLETGTLSRSQYGEP